MSSKINILSIVSGHFKTLRNDSANRVSILDVGVFYGIPVVLAAAGMYGHFSLNEKLTELLVNFGSILSALLLSVLVLVYDQSAKFREAKREVDHQEKHVPLLAKRGALLRQLYFNICYAVLISITVTLVCFVHGAVMGSTVKMDVPWARISFELLPGTYITTPLAIFLASNLILTVLMSVKRLHVLLESED